MSDKIVLTGIKPTGMPHIGNYIGALKPLIDRSKAHKTFMFIADLHSLNTMHNASEIKQHTYEIAALMISLGLDLNNTALFRQSDIDEIYQLNTLLMNVTPKGLMNRAHSYKAAMDKNTAAGLDIDAGINMGLYTYPILMTADILLYNTDIVPVGTDQKQHVEFARDIAGYFNTMYGQTFKLPEPVIGSDTGLIPGLDGRKMSKSYGNIIPLFDDDKAIKKAVFSVVTDSRPMDEPKDPDSVMVYEIYKAIATEEQIKEMADGLRNGKLGYGHVKNMLLDAIINEIKEPREKYNYYMAHFNEVEAMLQEGAAKARPVAQRTLKRLKDAVFGR